MKKARDGAWHPADVVFCTNRVEDEKVELRAQDWARFIIVQARICARLIVYTKRDILSDIPLHEKSARRGSNPRPPPWQGGAPPLSHSRTQVV